MSSPTSSPLYIFFHTLQSSLITFSYSLGPNGTVSPCLWYLVWHKLFHHIKKISGDNNVYFFPFQSLIPFRLKDYLFIILPRFTSIFNFEKIILLNSWDYSEVYKSSKEKESIFSCTFKSGKLEGETSHKKRLGGKKLKNLAWDITDSFLWDGDISKWRNAIEGRQRLRKKVWFRDVNMNEWDH